jgi:Putative peptidoglycan binding domain
MQTLKLGSTGPAVGLLRRLLNQNVVPRPNLPEVNLFGAHYNGAMARIDFGPHMDAAVKKFQTSKKLPPNGVVDAPTWKALGLTLDIDKNVKPASQPTNDTCYAAAATMVLGSEGSKSFTPGATPAGQASDDYWARSFASQFGWSLEYGMTPMPVALANYLQRGAFWMAGNLPFPSGPSYHAVVIGSIWGTGDSDSTMLLVYDPWPVNTGDIYGIILGDYLNQNPMAFRYTIHQ